MCEFGIGPGRKTGHDVELLEEGTYDLVGVRTGTKIVEAALTEYLNAHAHTDIVRAPFDKALHLHAVAFEKLEC